MTLMDGSVQIFKKARDGESRIYIPTALDRQLLGSQQGFLMDSDGLDNDTYSRHV